MKMDNGKGKIQLKSKTGASVFLTIDKEVGTGRLANKIYNFTWPIPY